MPESQFMKAFKVANFTIVEQPEEGACLAVRLMRAHPFRSSLRSQDESCLRRQACPEAPAAVAVCTEH